jgi:hypothetical protein
MTERSIIDEGEVAARALKEDKSREHWKAVGWAFAEARREAMRLAETDQMHGENYMRAWRVIMEARPTLLEIHERRKPSMIDAVWLYENWWDLEPWLDVTDPHPFAKWKHPSTIRKHYERHLTTLREEEMKKRVDEAIAREPVLQAPVLGYTGVPQKNEARTIKKAPVLVGTGAYQKNEERTPFEVTIAEPDDEPADEPEPRNEYEGPNEDIEPLEDDDHEVTTRKLKIAISRLRKEVDLRVRITEENAQLRKEVEELRNEAAIERLRQDTTRTVADDPDIKSWMSNAKH